MSGIIKVLDTTHYEVLAQPRTDGSVLVGVYKKGANPRWRSDPYCWAERTCGWLNPRPRSLWWRIVSAADRCQSVDEAIRTTVEKVHTAEFRLREGESRVEAARATIHAIASIERELDASCRLDAALGEG